MSILNVEHLTHGFGDRAIFHDVSFRLLKGEHIGLVGANGEGKSTFFNIFYFLQTFTCTIFLFFTFSTLKSSWSVSIIMFSFGFGILPNKSIK